jgi:hypothetical protein
VRVGELAVVVDLARQVGVVFARRLEHHARPIAQLVRRQVDLAEAALADELAQRIVAHCLQVCSCKFTAEPSAGALGGRAGVLLEELLVRIRQLLSAVSARLLHVKRGCLQRNGALPRVSRRMLTYLLPLRLNLRLRSQVGLHRLRRSNVVKAVCAASSSDAVVLSAPRESQLCYRI